MSLRRRITVAIVLTIVITVFGVVAHVGNRMLYTWRHIPEAYAAWDTGTLLVEYMKSHDGRWPSSWNDLLSVQNSGSGGQITLRGANAGDTNYGDALVKRVAIDWKFDPARGDQNSPVTRPDGSRFPIVWAGADPNEMVHAYWNASRNTNAPAIRQPGKF